MNDAMSTYESVIYVCVCVFVCVCVCVKCTESVSKLPRPSPPAFSRKKAWKILFLLPSFSRGLNLKAPQPRPTCVSTWSGAV